MIMDENITNKGITILIAEDEESNFLLLKTILKKHCNILHAKTGVELLEIYKEQHADLILLDIKMPEMDGLELIRTLKEKNYPGEILVLSNYEDFDSVRSALLLGAADYLLKIKISPDTLLACLNKTTEKLQEKAGAKPVK